jgi:hypothetical protein
MALKLTHSDLEVCDSADFGTGLTGNILMIFILMVVMILAAYGLKFGLGK